MTSPASGDDWTFSGSYDPDDVIFLLKPAIIAATPVAEKERLIQSGARHYSEMLSAERAPDARYMRLYRAALADNAEEGEFYYTDLVGLVVRDETGEPVGHPDLGDLFGDFQDGRYPLQFQMN